MIYLKKLTRELIRFPFSLKPQATLIRLYLDDLLDYSKNMDIKYTKFMLTGGFPLNVLYL